MFIRGSLGCSQQYLDEFKKWYEARTINEISIRQALSMMNFAMHSKRKVEDVSPYFWHYGDGYTGKN
jgi:hypothetical protein